MPNFSRLVIFAASLATAWGQGTSDVRRTNIEDADTRRHLVEDAECVLYLKIVDFADGRPDEASWSCAFEEGYSRSIGSGSTMNIEGISMEAITSYKPISGEAVMRTQGAYIRQSVTTGVSTLVVPDNVSFDIEKLMEDDRRHHRQRQRHRNLQDDHRRIGTKRTLVVRVTDINDNVMAADKAQLMDDIFNDASCLKTQYAACSHNQLMFEPSTEGGGVIEMKVQASSSDSTAMEAQVNIELGNLYNGEAGIREQFDYVLFCKPDFGSTVAYAYVNRWDSYYNGAWCQSASAQIHEVGHNLGLAHSWFENIEYNDISGLMGFSYADDDTLMCFNAAKNFQLGWYPQQELALDPLSLIGNPTTYVLNGVVDYQTSGSPEGKLVVIRIIENGDDFVPGTDYYVGFNRASGSNAGTQAIPNQVAVWSKPKDDAANSPYTVAGPYTPGLSRRVKDLTVGETYSIPNFRGGVYTIFIEWVSLSSDGKDATIKVYTSDEVPTSAPTTQCGSLAEYQFKILTDPYAVETGWVLRKKEDQSVIASKSDFGPVTSYVLPSGNQYYCLSEGCYENILTDTFKDGILAPATFSGHLNGEQIFGYQLFGAELTNEFCVTGAVSPTPSPTRTPTQVPTRVPTKAPTQAPTQVPTQAPVISPTQVPTQAPTRVPTQAPTQAPVISPTQAPTQAPTQSPTRVPTQAPTQVPTPSLTSGDPTFEPTFAPTFEPTFAPTFAPTSGSCEDDASFKFNNSKKKTCKKWVGRGKNNLGKKKNVRKIKKKCRKRVKKTGGLRVFDFCPATCSLVDQGPCA